MARLKFHIGINLRCYGNVTMEADSIEAALPMLTADFIGDHIDIHETTTDSGEQIALIDVADAETDETLGDWAGRSLPSPYDPKPDADLLAALKDLVATSGALKPGFAAAYEAATAAIAKAEDRS